jgi:hypothetical protein
LIFDFSPVLLVPNVQPSTCSLCYVILQVQALHAQAETVVMTHTQTNEHASAPTTMPTPVTSAAAVAVAHVTPAPATTSANTTVSLATSEPNDEADEGEEDDDGGEVGPSQARNRARPRRTKAPTKREVSSICQFISLFVWFGLVWFGLVWFGFCTFWCSMALSFQIPSAPPPPLFDAELPAPLPSSNSSSRITSMDLRNSSIYRKIKSNLNLLAPTEPSVPEDEQQQTSHEAVLPVQNQDRVVKIKMDSSTVGATNLQEMILNSRVFQRATSKDTVGPEENKQQLAARIQAASIGTEA